MGVLLNRIAQERVSAGLVPFFFFVIPPNYCARRQVRRLSQQLEPCWERKRIKSAGNWCIWVPKKDGFLSCCERGMSPNRGSNLSTSNSALRRTTTEPQQDRKYQLVRGLLLVKQSEIVNVKRRNSSEGLITRGILTRPKLPSSFYSSAGYRAAYWRASFFLLHAWNNLRHWASSVIAAVTFDTRSDSFSSFTIEPLTLSNISFIDLPTKTKFISLTEIPFFPSLLE